MSLIVLERQLRPRSVMLNLCNELEAKPIKFVLLTTRYVYLIVFIICAVFCGAASMNSSKTLLLRFKNNI